MDDSIIFIEKSTGKYWLYSSGQLSVEGMFVGEIPEEWLSRYLRAIFVETTTEMKLGNSPFSYPLRPTYSPKEWEELGYISVQWGKNNV